MYDVVFISAVKSITPYFTTPLSGKLSSTELIFISYFVKFFLLIFVIIGFLIYNFKDSHINIKNVFEKCKNLDKLHIFYIILYCIFGMVTTLVTINLSFSNNPTILFILSKILPSIIMLFIGYIFIKENITYTKVFGVLLASVGVYMIGKD